MAVPPTPARFRETARSSARLPISLAVVLKGADSAGDSFTENTRTLLVNRRGAKILTRQSLSLGTRLQVTAVHLKRESWATVAWLGEKRGPEQEIGIDLDDGSEFWGVQFPEDAVAQQVDQILKKWHPQADEIFNRSQMEALEQVQDLLRQVVENCLAQLEEHAAVVVERQAQACDHILEQLIHKAEQRLADRLAEYEARMERMAEGQKIEGRE